MTTTPYEYPLEERKMHQSSGHHEPYKEVRIYCRLRYPFQAIISFIWKHTLEILLHFLWTKRCSNTGWESILLWRRSRHVSPSKPLASRGHDLTASHNLFLSLGREEAKMCLGFSVSSNCCQTTYTKLRLNSTNSFMKAAGQPINAAKESKVKLKTLLKQDLHSLFVHVP